jgi:hypothetical protein
MKKGSFFDESNTTKYFVIKQPTNLTDLDYEELDDDTNASWRIKSRQLQARRWRMIKNQTI